MKHIIAAGLALAGHLSAAQSNVVPYDANACAELQSALPGKVAYPNTTAYALSNTYWSVRQSETRPTCFVHPSSPSEVSTTLKILTSLDAPFTVKSGGHNAFPTASNIQDGVTVDLASLNSISVSADQKTASVGPGARWINVTNALDPLGLSVVGGRSPDVGVSGLILGGGISFLSGHHGWACDNVQNFQVALASGDVIDANPAENPDLYRALRGGSGSSFGVVTRFDLDVYRQESDVWSRFWAWPEAQTTRPLGDFVVASRDVLPVDKDAHLFYNIAYDTSLAAELVTVSGFHLTHADAPAGTGTGGSTPDAFEGFQRIPEQISNETVVANMSGLLGQLAEPYGLRKSWFTTTVRDGAGVQDLLVGIIDLWRSKPLAVLRDAAEARRNSTLGMFFVIQPISTATMEAMKKNGGNALGIEGGAVPIFNIHTQASWVDASLDGLVEDTLAGFIEGVDRLAGEFKLSNRFKYMNYAGRTQDVFASYGEENVRRLREVAGKYDPERKLRGLWKGYFKFQ